MKDKYSVSMRIIDNDRNTIASAGQEGDALVALEDGDVVYIKHSICCPAKFWKPQWEVEVKIIG